MVGLPGRAEGFACVDVFDTLAQCWDLVNPVTARERWSDLSTRRSGVTPNRFGATHRNVRWSSDLLTLTSVYVSLGLDRPG